MVAATSAQKIATQTRAIVTTIRAFDRGRRERRGGQPSRSVPSQNNPKTANNAEEAAREGSKRLVHRDRTKTMTANARAATAIPYTMRFLRRLARNRRKNGAKKDGRQSDAGHRKWSLPITIAVCVPHEKAHVLCGQQISCNRQHSEEKSGQRTFDYSARQSSQR